MTNALNGIEINESAAKFNLEGRECRADSSLELQFRRGTGEDFEGVNILVDFRNHLVNRQVST